MDKLTSRFVVLLVASSLAWIPAASTLADPAPGADSARDILKKAASAIEAVKVARYQAHYEGTGWVADRVPAVEGTVVVGEPSEHDISRFRCEVRLTPPGGDDVITLTAGSDGDDFYLIDAKTKTVYVDMDAAVLGSHSRNVQRVVMRELVTAKAIVEALEAETVELGETAVVGEVACHRVRVESTDGPPTTWFIGTEDFLPRRVERTYDNDRGAGSTRLVLTNLRTETSFSLAPFKLKMPDGFTRSDDFAP